MIILRQKQYSILNKLGGIGNIIGNLESAAESGIRNKISSRKSKKLKDELLKHVGKYHNISYDGYEGYLPNEGNINEDQKGKPYFTRRKGRGGGTIYLSKNSSPFKIAHEYGHSLDFAAPHGNERFTRDGRNRNKLDEIWKDGFKGSGDPIKDAKEALKLNKSSIEREVAADINALKLLKKKGATQKELDRAKQEAKAGLRSYKSSAKSDINYLMQNSSLSDDLKFRREHMRDAKKQYKEAVKKLDNMYGPNKLAQKEKAALIGLGSAAAIGTGAYLIHKHRKKKKESEENKKENKNDNT